MSSDQERLDQAAPGKSGRLVALPMALTVAVAVVVHSWLHKFDLGDWRFAVLAQLNAWVWLIILWWSLHQLTFQLAALLKLPVAAGARLPSPPTGGTPDPLPSLPAAGGDPRQTPASALAAVSEPAVRFALFYLTCNDFDPGACRSCLDQSYDPERYSVLVCDDSDDPAMRAEVADFIAANPRLKLSRRGTRQGFKAGNLNHAFGSDESGYAAWIVIIDADQVLPDTYLQDLARSIAGLPEDVAFVQTAHDPKPAIRKAPGAGLGDTIFQDAIGPEIRLFYQRDLCWRQKYGFLPALGHGLAVRSEAWRKLGGFPLLVSEDYAFSLEVSNRRWRGIYLATIRSQEAFPCSFRAFVIRLRKFAGGSAELLRRSLWTFLSGPASGVEKLDFAMLILWYPLLPLILANSFLSAFVCHHWWSLGVSALHPLLPYLFLGMFLLTFPIVVSATGSSGSALRYWFWSAAVYSAALPLAAGRFLLHMVTPPRFEVTPKREDRGHPPRLIAASVLTPLLGLVAVALSLRWWSPFTPVLAGYGTAYSMFPMLLALHRPGLMGKLARAVVWLPGALFLLALVTMWRWGKL